jgi:hypothetical protein
MYPKRTNNNVIMKNKLSDINISLSGSWEEEKALRSRTG